MVSLSRAHYHKRKGQARAPLPLSRGRFRFLCSRASPSRQSPRLRTPGAVFRRAAERATPRTPFSQKTRRSDAHPRNSFQPRFTALRRERRYSGMRSGVKALHARRRLNVHVSQQVKAEHAPHLRTTPPPLPEAAC